MLFPYLLTLILVASSATNALPVPRLNTLGLDMNSDDSPQGWESQSSTVIVSDRHLQRIDGEQREMKMKRDQQDHTGTQVVRSIPTPTSSSPSPTASMSTSVSRTPKEAGIKARLLKLLASSVDWIVPSIMMTFSAAAIRHLHNTQNDTGLMAGAGAAEGVFALVRTDATTTTPLLIALFLVYISAHIVYCRIVCHKLAQGEGFVAITVIAATLLLATLVQLPGLVELWTESSGLPSLWTILPLHMVSVYFCSFAVRLGTPFLKTPSRDCGG
ncbi:hypothetical protein C7974DRAFT_387609 [Boeremia exigua]|uniref:uncharacterized protein n=1 Tax=Boeremia exigua TaxID=749465 RepID=UPI001E8D3D23|nr:uncharacterized protein C7974DRAFT_387609 [Boeremia exigua]KAH6638955.1 hypothetical protein C7974DRAFT_387609 [Boeremia exigua]